MSQPHSAFSDGGFLVPDHDFELRSGSTATHGPTQILYYIGGSAAGKLVATETITYDANNYIATRAIVENNLPSPGGNPLP